MIKLTRQASPGELVRFLAVFERCFRYIQKAGMWQDRDAMLLGGHLADALHNVPDLLCKFDTDDWNCGSRFDRDLRRTHEIPEYHGAPRAIVRSCAYLLEPERLPGELGLGDDLSDLDVAPPEKLASYLTRLYEACLDLRAIRNFGFPPPDVGYPCSFWITSDANWVPDGDAHGNYNAFVAEVYLPIPRALVSWSLFDESGYWADLERQWTTRFGPESWERVRPEIG